MSRPYTSIKYIESQARALSPHAIEADLECKNVIANNGAMMHDILDGNLEVNPNAITG